MKFLSYFKKVKIGKRRESDHLKTMPDQKDKRRRVSKRVVPLWPVLPTQEAEWLKLYRAMDTAG